MISVVSSDGLSHRKYEREFTFERISSHMERVLFTVAFIANCRLGATLDTVRKVQKDRFGTSERTAQRDISTMVAAGLVVVERIGRQNIFRLNQSMRLGQLLSKQSCNEAK